MVVLVRICVKSKCLLGRFLRIKWVHGSSVGVIFFFFWDFSKDLMVAYLQIMPHGKVFAHPAPWLWASLNLKCKDWRYQWKNHQSILLRWTFFLLFYRLCWTKNPNLHWTSAHLDGFNILFIFYAGPNDL